MQKSIREGFGLVVSESLWKGTPVIAGHAGGIPLQMPAGVGGATGATASRSAPAAMLELLRDRELAADLGQRGREQVREHFLLPRLLMEELRLLSTLDSPGPTSADHGQGMTEPTPVQGSEVDVEEAAELLLRDLRSSAGGPVSARGTAAADSVRAQRAAPSRRPEVAGGAGASADAPAGAAAVACGGAVIRRRQPNDCGRRSAGDRAQRRVRVRAGDAGRAGGGGAGAVPAAARHGPARWTGVRRSWPPIWFPATLWSSRRAIASRPTCV